MKRVTEVLREITWIWPLVSLAATPAAHAFGLGDHANIAIQAIVEYGLCHPDSTGLIQESVWVDSDIEEDINPLRKILQYAHYYNPTVRLSMIRGSSMDAVSAAQGEIAFWGRLPQAQRAVGHILHHVQDAASPPHVAPVDHGLSDGFEGFDTSSDELILRGPEANTMCDGIPAGRGERDFRRIEHETALETLRSLHQPIAPGELDWDEAYWQPTTTRDFGRYGLYGNTFGEEGRFPRSTFAAFKRARMRAAVEASKRVIHAYVLGR